MVSRNEGRDATRPVVNSGAAPAEALALKSTLLPGMETSKYCNSSSSPSAAAATLVTLDCVFKFAAKSLATEPSVVPSGTVYSKLDPFTDNDSKLPATGATLVKVRVNWPSTN